MSVVWFSLQILTLKSLILRRIQRGMIIITRRFSCKLPGFLVIFQWVCQVSRQIFEKYSDIKHNENPSRVSRVVPCRRIDEQTDRQTDTQRDMAKLIALCNFCEPSSYAALPKWCRTFLRRLWKGKISEGTFKQYCFSKTLSVPTLPWYQPAVTYVCNTRSCNIV
jgi:hypothetical protein